MQDLDEIERVKRLKAEEKEFRQKVEEFHAYIEKGRAEKEKERRETLICMYEHFLGILDPDVRKYIFLSEQLLAFAVSCYFDSIYRFKFYARSCRADRHKQAAYLYKWIAKTKPIQVKPVQGVFIEDLGRINSMYATHVALAVLGNEGSRDSLDYIDPNQYANLVYQATFRNISGRAVAAQLSAIESACISKAKLVAAGVSEAREEAALIEKES